MLDIFEKQKNTNLEVNHFQSLLILHFPVTSKSTHTPLMDPRPTSLQLPGHLFSLQQLLRATNGSSTTRTSTAQAQGRRLYSTKKNLEPKFSVLHVGKNTWNKHDVNLQWRLCLLKVYSSKSHVQQYWHGCWVVAIPFENLLISSSFSLQSRYFRILSTPWTRSAWV